MSLDIQIKELQDKKKQIAFLEKAKELITKKATDDVLITIADQLNSEIDLQISAIETGERRPDEFEVFSEDEVRALKGLAHKILNPKPSKSKVQKQEPTTDKVRFGLENRHLANKQVKVGDETGIVVGLDSPNVIVRLTKGNTIEVPLGQIIL